MQAKYTAFRHKALQEVLFFLSLGGIAGVLNGLLGTGGGIILVLVLSRKVKQASPFFGQEAGLTPRDIYANALSVMLPISVLTAFRYASGNALNIASFAPLILPSVIGGLFGGFLLDRLKLSLLKALFSALLLVSGILMIVRAS